MQIETKIVLKKNQCHKTIAEKNFVYFPTRKSIMKNNFDTLSKHVIEINELTELLRKTFPSSDLSELTVMSRYHSSSGILALRVGRSGRSGRSGKGFGVVINPSLMTSFEADALSYFMKKGTEENIVEICLDIFQRAVFIKPDTIVTKQLDIFENWIRSKNIKYCFLDQELQKNSETSVLSFTLWSKGNAQFLREIPKCWNFSETASFLLATGDLPTRRKMQKIMQDEKNRQKLSSPLSSMLEMDQ